MSKQSQARAEEKATVLRTEMNLADLRRAAQLSQEELASTLGVGQASVAKLEKRTDMFVSTLRRFIKAMGGELEIAAIFGRDRVLIEQFHTLRPTSVNAVPIHVGGIVSPSSRNVVLAWYPDYAQQGTRAQPTMIATDPLQNIYQQRPVALPSLAEA